jgi:proteic killer suppression protein
MGFHGTASINCASRIREYSGSRRKPANAARCWCIHKERSVFFKRCYPSLDARQQGGYFPAMRIRNVVHRGLRNLIERDDRSGVPAVVAGKILRIVLFLQDMQHEDELSTIPGWKAHLLTGNRKGVWSLSVTKNWRITFRIDRQDVEIIDLNFEDYH